MKSSETKNSADKFFKNIDESNKLVCFTDPINSGMVQAVQKLHRNSKIDHRKDFTYSGHHLIIFLEGRVAE